MKASLKKPALPVRRMIFFAASCYCPITNLEHGGYGLEWEFNGYDNYQRMHGIGMRRQGKKDGSPDGNTVGGTKKNVG